MKKILILAIFLTNFCFGVSLMNYEFFDNENSVDIVLSFDSAYTPDIYKKIDSESQIITLKNVKSDEKFTNQLNSKIISEFGIIPSGGETQIVFNKGKDLNIEALSQNDKLSLILRVKNPNFKQLAVQNDESNINSDEKSGPNFIFVILSVIAVLIIALIFIKLMKKNKKSVDAAWSIFENEQNGGLEDNLKEEINEQINKTVDEKVQNFSQLNTKFENFTPESFEKNLESNDKSNENQEKTDELKMKNEEIDYQKPEISKIDANDDFKNLSKNFEDDEDDELIGTDDIKVVFQKKIDEKNRAVVLNLLDKNYLVVLKDSNVLPKN